MSELKKVSDLDPGGLRLVQEAERIQKLAYAPYSKFLVGSALLDENGKIHTGCNVENASYSVTICGERSALAHLVAGGGHSITRVAVITTSSEPIFPCGVCLQAISEFAQPDTEILAVASDAQTYTTQTLGDVFPSGFTREQLQHP